jgi:hypothetical protein
VDGLVALLQHSNRDVGSVVAWVLEGLIRLYSQILNVSHMALHALLDYRLKRGSMSCVIWDGKFYIKNSESVWTSPLQKQQLELLEQAFGAA